MLRQVQLQLDQARQTLDDEVTHRTQELAKSNEQLKKERGEHFDPEILDIFITNFDQFLEIRGKIGTFKLEADQNFMLSERDKTKN